MHLKLPRLYSKMLKENRRWQRQVKSLVNEIAKAKPTGVRPARKRGPATKLVETSRFGLNPGNLRMLSYVPPGLQRGAALVVVLHGCHQTAEDFDRASGWSALAKRHGFAVLFPEQKASNNPNRCFNWFRPSAVRRDRGEAGSVFQMIETMRRRFRIAPDRIYVFGLSAGGALSTALLAAYPDIFAGGCIVAGMPFGAARDAVTALRVMRHGAGTPQPSWGALVREAAPRPNWKQWPTVAVWQGERDHVVTPANADAVVGQWLDLHALPRASARVRQTKHYTNWQWKNAANQIAVEEFRLDDMGHGLPVTKAGRERASDKQFYLDVGVCAAAVMAKRWDLGARAISIAAPRRAAAG